MNLENFVKQFVNIEFIEASNGYGHFPYQGYTSILKKRNSLIPSPILPPLEEEEKQHCLFSIPLGRIKDVHRVFREINFDVMYCSIDFSGKEDIKDDFVAVISFEEKKWSIYAIPYDEKTGTLKEEIKSSLALDRILKEFREGLAL